MAQKNTQKKSFAKGVLSEWKKINWPTPKEIVNYALVIVAVSVVIALIVFGLDSIFHFLYGLISK